MIRSLAHFLILRQIDESRSDRHRHLRVTYAQPPRTFPSMVLNGGKGTSVSGCYLGPIVSGVVAGELASGT